MARPSSHGSAHGPHWPSVEEQLKALKVVPGSALEQTIRDNQDFGMLLPSEANDGLGFPPWLRVWWRKKHPELDFSGPRVGYSLILKDILGRMMQSQNRPPGQKAPGAARRP